MILYSEKLDMIVVIETVVTEQISQRLTSIAYNAGTGDVSCLSPLGRLIAGDFVFVGIV